MSHSLRSTTESSPRATRHARPATSYEEPSSDIDEELSFAAMASDSDASDKPLTTRRPSRRTPRMVATPKRRRQDPLPSSTPSTRSQLNRSPKRRRVADTANVKHGKTSSITRPKEQPSILDPDPHSSGIVPPWPSLPYHILVQIFKYASYPLHDEFHHRTISADWLLKTSRICRNFAEPALSVLYLSPPLTSIQALKLKQLLTADQSHMSFKYRAKIESFKMEIRQTCEYSLGKEYGRLDLYDLVRNCPRLTALELYYEDDMPPYKNLGNTLKWRYPENLFAALSANVNGVATRLQSWRWSSRLGGTTWPVEKMEEIHLTPSFQGLRKIAFVNYQDQLPRLRKSDPDPEHEKKIAKSLSVLPDLEHLIFDSSSIVNATLLPLLPNDLKHLELINCSEVLADDMTALLLTHGYHLETLVLNHNQSLSLSFLTVLAEACPHLRSLRMNLAYYNTHSTYNDSEPLYKELLREDEIPTWPSSLQTLELTQLRQWDADRAKVFFESVLKGAKHLPNLRSLTIKAIINTSWRERSTFRDTWVGAFDRVFKRKYTPPNPHFRSIGAFEYWKKKKSETKIDTRTTERDKVGGEDTQVSHRIQDAIIRQKRSISSRHTNYDGPSYQAQTSPKPKARPQTRLASNSSSPSSKSATNNHVSSSGRQRVRSRTVTRELEILRKTAGKDAPKQDHYTAKESYSEPDMPSEDSFVDSDDEPLVRPRGILRKSGGNAQAQEFIQGMCDTVLVKIDNLRPAETQFQEADFLDSEPDGDADWDGNDDDDTGYAW